MKEKYDIREIPIPIGIINVLPQIRPVCEATDIQNIAKSIVEIEKLINRIDIAYLSYKEAKEYVKHINLIHETKISINTLKRYKRMYYLLIAGEQRLSACKLLCKSGEYKKIFGHEKIDAKIYRHISPEDATNIQSDENIHHPVRPEYAARFYAKYYRALLIKKPKISLAEFARKVKRSPDTIKDSFRFEGLPLKIRQIIMKHNISYGIACELGRLKEDGETEELLFERVRSIIAVGYTTKKYKEIVDEIIRVKHSGQMELLNIMTENQERKETASGRRYFIEKNTTQSFYTETYYFKKILRLFRENQLPIGDSPFLKRGPVKAFRILIECLKETIPHMEKVLASKEFKASKKIVEKNDIALTKIEKVLYVS